MIRKSSVVLLALCLGTAQVRSAETFTSEAEAKATMEQALVVLKSADGNQANLGNAMLKFTRLMEYYTAKQDEDRACDMQAYIYWCRKRLPEDAAASLSKAKGTGDQALARKVEEMVGKELPNDSAEGYLSKVDAYAKANPGENLTIAVRYFEVADRFAGTRVSLKAQKSSLEAMQKASANLSSSLGNPFSKDLQIPTVSASGLPEEAQKITAASDAIVSNITAKTGLDLAKEKSKAQEVLSREFEAAQRKGDLDYMLLCQRQAKNLDDDEKGLSKSAKYSVEQYRIARLGIISKASMTVIDERKKMARALTTLQTEEVRKGNMAAAVTIKKSCDTLMKDLESASQSVIAGIQDVEQPFVLKPKGGMFLGHLTPISLQGFSVQVVTKTKPGDKVVLLDGTPCNEYLFAHAPSDLTYPIPAGTRQFTAYGMSSGSQSIRFIVTVDGKELYSKSLEEKPKDEVGLAINVHVPPDAKKIRLTTDPMGGNNSDHSMWAYPYFSK